VESLLSRPPDQRAREQRFRFGQAVVFGLPVLALQWFGTDLGGPEARRWVALLQAVLCGWIVYTGASGPVFEGIVRVLAGRGLSLDLLVAGAATAVFIFSLIATVSLLMAGHALPPLFHVVVIVLGGWSGLQALRWRGAEPARSV
jgi:cation transport ATPase